MQKEENILVVSGCGFSMNKRSFRRIKLMNKNLKFRVWDKTLSKFVSGIVYNDHDFQDEFYLDLDGSLRILNYDHLDEVEYFHKDRFIIQQYTGLKDLQGKEIYEGDIVESSNFIDFSYPDRYIVKFCEDEDTDNNRVPRMIGFNVHCNTIVLGNIFENPELLK